MTPADSKTYQASNFIIDWWMRNQVQTFCTSTALPCPALLFQLHLLVTLTGPNPSQGLLAEDHWLPQECQQFVLPLHIRCFTSKTCPNRGQRQNARGHSIHLVQTEHLQNTGKRSPAISSEQFSPKKGRPHPPAEPAIHFHGDWQAKITDVMCDLLHFGVCFLVLFLNKGSSLSDPASSLQLVWFIMQPAGRWAHTSGAIFSH